MADVKWIKITTDIFDDDKILLIESLPDADSIIVIWFKLLCLAGKQNNSGVFLLNDRIPYTDTMLATIFRRKEATVQLALKTFQEFGMIDIVDGVITIPNWGKHQNLDQLERKTEYMRNYMRDYRAKQKQLIDGSSEAIEKTEKAGNTNCKTNSKANVSSLDKNRLDKSRLEKNRERVTGVIGGGYPTGQNETEEDSANADTHTNGATHKYGEYGWVRLTDEQYRKLLTEYGEAELKRCITYIDESAQSSKNKNGWKDWNLVIRRCHRDRWGLPKGEAKPTGRVANYDYDDDTVLPY